MAADQRPIYSRLLPAVSRTRVRAMQAHAWLQKQPIACVPRMRVPDVPASARSCVIGDDSVSKSAVGNESSQCSRPRARIVTATAPSIRTTKKLAERPLTFGALQTCCHVAHPGWRPSFCSDRRYSQLVLCFIPWFLHHYREFYIEDCNYWK